jgi:hypothetical protein
MRLIGVVSLIALTAGCGGKDNGCDPGDAEACDDGLTCEKVDDPDEEEDVYGCFQPVSLHGNVFDVSDESAIAGARVVPLDANGAPAGRVGVSDADGNYTVGVAVTRDVDGVPIGAGTVTLRADASGYQPFPGGIRTSLPVDVGQATEGDDGWSLQTPLTDIGLVPLGDGAPSGSIHGAVEVPGAGIGVLVVAEQGDASLTAVADTSGDYRIFNAASGGWSVTGYAIGANHATVSADVPDGGDVEANIGIEGDATATVSGTVQIVNAPGGSGTSVILAVESTFDELTARGSAPPGLRLPEDGAAPNISGDYAFTGVPDGRYVVLGAFEDDGLVRDPDYEQGGTEIQHIEVSGGDVTVDGFKITEALEIFSPGGNGPEEVSGSPVLKWKDDSGEKAYDILVFDSLGQIVWEHTIDGVSGDDPAVTYAGDALETGMFYQFRVTSIDQGGVPISRTQDLDGVFQIVE